MMSAAQQSPDGGTATIKHRVQMGPLQQPLLRKQRVQSVSWVHTLHNEHQTDDKHIAFFLNKHLRIIVKKPLKYQPTYTT